VGRISLIVAAVVLLVLAAGVAFMGIFPPEPQTRTIERPVPLERVAPGGAPATAPAR
jgi:hypothetical protein